MPQVRFPFLLFLLCACLVSSCGFRKTLPGRWKIVSLNQQEQNPDDAGVIMVFEKKGTFYMEEGEIWEGTYTTDTRDQPAQLVLRVTTPPLDKKPPTLAIYKFEKGTLILKACRDCKKGDPFPQDFNPAPGYEIIALKRRKR